MVWGDAGGLRWDVGRLTALAEFFFFGGDHRLFETLSTSSALRGVKGKKQSRRPF
ncbi:MAG: hypothetical protein LBQ50_12070 [Planctomycetaceae bacterium]|nr:hypothetical protein [Planctomycetaceae bacterium]